MEILLTDSLLVGYINRIECYIFELCTKPCVVRINSLFMQGGAVLQSSILPFRLEIQTKTKRTEY